MRTRSRTVAILIVLLLSTLALAACAAQANSTAQTTAERTAAAKRGTIRASVSASGKIDPAGEVNLNFSVPGTVQDVLVSEGDTVKQGDVIAKLDTDSLELAVKQAEQALAACALLVLVSYLDRAVFVEAVPAPYSGTAEKQLPRPGLPVGRQVLRGAGRGEGRTRPMPKLFFAQERGRVFRNSFFVR